MIHLSLRTIQKAANYFACNSSAILTTSELSVDALGVWICIYSTEFYKNTWSYCPGFWLDKVSICYFNLIDTDNEINQWISKRLKRRRERN